MKLTKTLSSLLIGFLLSIIIFGGAIYFTYQSESNLFLDFNEVEKIHTTIEKTKSVSNLINKLEASIRGYGISKNNSFLEDYKQNSTELDVNLLDLEELLSDIPSQLQKLNELKALLDQKLSNLDAKILASENNTKDNTALVARIVQGRTLSVQITQLENNIVAEQQVLLIQKHNNAIKDFKKTKLTIEIICSAALAMSILIIIFFFEYAKIHSKAERELLELNENKNKFFSIISHDLRNPVKNIVLMAQLLTEPQNSKSYDPLKIATMIQGSANNLSSLLDNLLNWSRLQMNRIEFIPEKLDLYKIVDDVIRHQKVNAGQKNISLKNTINQGLYAFVDQNMITTVLRNLISNGIKFTEKGGTIELGAVIFNNEIELSVSDNGVGMPKEVLEKIFSIDFKLSTKGTNKEEGTGLGLKLVKEFIEKNKGKVRAESELTKGSRFIVTLPTAKLVA